jgi:transposase
MLLAAVYAGTAPEWLRQVPAVETLRRVWLQNYYREGGADVDRLRWRTDDQGIPPASIFVSSPYDQDAHDAVGRLQSACY